MLYCLINILLSVGLTDIKVCVCYTVSFNVCPSVSFPFIREVDALGITLGVTSFISVPVT